jgi:integrase
VFRLDCGKLWAAYRPISGAPVRRRSGEIRTASGAPCHRVCPTGSRSARPRVHPAGRYRVAVVLRFLRYRGDITTDLAVGVPSVANWPQTDLPKHLAADAVQTVLDGCDLTTPVGRRDHAILLLLARLGLRAGEVVTLQLEDIDWDNGQLTIRSKKGRGCARLPMPSDVGKAISRYLRLDRPRCSCRNVFVCMVAPYRRFSTSCGISDLTRNAIQRAGVESVRTGAHLFRHYAASRTMPQVDIAEAVHRLCSSGCAAYFVTRPGTLGE